MPKLIREFFYKVPIQRHLVYAFVLGALARGLSAIFVYGPQALDDYKHGVWPAYQFFAGLPIDLPDYRSHLLIWFLGFFAEIASWVGATSALAQVRAMYLGLGATSLVAIWGTYLYAKNFKSPVFTASALYLVALFPLMPFVSTRAFGEAVAMSFVAWGFGILANERMNGGRRLRPWVAGFFILGLATLFRFHVGILYLAYMGVLAVSKNKRGIYGALIAGVFILGLQGLIDSLSGKEAFGTLLTYLRENQGGGAKYGVMPWYNTWLLFFGIALAPFCFVMWKHWRGVWERHWPVIVPLLLFVGAHSLAAHKEERFLYPILVLELWVIASFWSDAMFDDWARRLYSPVLIGLTLLLLPVVTLVNTQEGEIEPPAVLESRYGGVLFLDYESLFGESRFQFYFLRPPSMIEEVTPEDFVAHRVDKGFSDHQQISAVAFVTSDPEAYNRLRALEKIRTIEGECLKIQRSGSLTDRLLFALNPSKNQRRRPTWYLACEKRS